MSVPERDAREVRPRDRRRLSRWLRVAAVVVVAWLVASWAVAYRLTRRPRSVFAEAVPAVAWAEFEGLRLSTRDGEEVGGWYSPGKAGTAAVLLLHGNGGSRWNCLRRAEVLAKRGHPVLMISLRAHGDSSGDYHDIGYGARHDVVAAVEFLERRRPGSPIVVVGTSMGGASALFAAGELGRRVRGYVLESPYRDLRTAVWNRVNNALPIGLDWVAYRGLIAVSPLVLPHLDRIAPVDAIKGVPDDVPILILAGDADRKARPDEARDLFDRARSHAELTIFAGAGHLGMMETDPERYWKAVFGLIARAATQ